MTIIEKAAAVLQGGGVIAYPTEGIFGLGCLPDHLRAVARLLEIKRRDASKGLILIAANADQFEGWIELPDGVSLPDPDPSKPITWLVPTAGKVAAAVRGDNVGIAVRITTHPLVRSICDAVASPIVSTSANVSGEAIVADQLSLRRQFRSLVDYIVPGDCGPATGASEIRHFATGAILRPR